MPRRYPKQEYAPLGKLIERLTHSLAKVKDWTMEETMNYIGSKTGKSSDMVYRWQQGKLLPKKEVIEVLARIGYEEAELSREWGEELLREAHYPESTNLLNKLWGPKELRTIPCNLPHREHTRLIGRENDMEDLRKYLSPDHAAYLITVDGIGGVGKTALVLEVAHEIWHASTGETVKPHIPTFEAIIFVSAKQESLTAQGLLPRAQVSHTLRQLFQEVTSKLKRDDIRSTPFQEQPHLVREALGHQRTLLIVDNLETMENRQEIMSFLYGLPPAVKVVITTRERVVLYTPILLDQLAEEAALELIKQQTKEKQVLLAQEEIQDLYKRIGGIPAALVYAIGQRAAGYSVETILRKVPSAERDVARFCFQASVEPLRGENAHKMLMAFALFPQKPLRDVVTYVAGLDTDPFEVDEALSQLQCLSLVRELEKKRFRMLPLTREYALAELKRYPDFEREARERWIKWYQDFAQKYGGHDKGEWHVSYDYLNEEWENLLELFEWCASEERYDEMKAFWCAEEPSSVVDFTALYGYWDDRLTWLDWLINAAEARADWLTVLDAIVSKATILSLMNRYEEADEWFQHSQRYQSYAVPYVQVSWLLNYAYPLIFEEKFSEVTRLLDQARDRVQEVEDPLRARFILHIDYNYASVFYWQENIAAAKDAFRSVMERANVFDWRWLAISAQLYLGDIATKEGDYEEAERLLETGLRIAERNKETRRTARYKRSLAYLRQKQGRVNEALTLADEARDLFSRLNRLGIAKEIERIDDLIRELKKEITSD